MLSIPLNTIDPLYPSYYIVYEDGRILNTNSGRFLKIDSQNRYSLDYIGKDKPVHRSIRKIYKALFNKAYHGLDTTIDLADEEWKEIEGTNEAYYISNYGRIKSYMKHANPRILNPYFKSVSKPYLYIDISIDGQMVTFPLSRLVAKHFLADTYSAEKDVHHKDCNPLNNHVSNLECLSKEEHLKRHGKVQSNDTL